MNRFNPDADDVIAVILLLAMLLGIGVFFYNIAQQGR